MKDRVFAIAHYADQGVLYLLIILSLVSIVLIVERFLVLRKAVRKSRLAQNQLQNLLKNKQLEHVPQIKGQPDSLETRFIEFANDHLNRYGRKGFDEVYSAFINHEKPMLERSLTFLATVGSNAPYIGLFGTVLGIMKSFNDLAQASDAGQNTVMAGISAALIATATGLLVAIPNILAFNFFQKQVRGIFVGIDTLKDALMASTELKREGK